MKSGVIVRLKFEKNRLARVVRVRRHLGGVFVYYKYSDNSDENIYRTNRENVEIISKSELHTYDVIES
jgi:acetolactate synthase regulatory subunit